MVVVGCCVERVKRSCGDLEGGLGFIEGKVRDLYKSLIDVGLFCYFCVSSVFMIPLFSSFFDFYFVNDNEMKHHSKFVEWFAWLLMYCFFIVSYS